MELGLILLLIAAEPEWPDPGSEEPDSPKLFPADPTDTKYDESAEVGLEMPEDLAEPIYRYSWYGWRNLIGDGAAVALFVTSIATESIPVLIASAVTYAIGGPVAHFTKGNWGRALISFGMRIAGPGLLGLAFFGTKCAIDEGCDGDDTTLIAFGIGALLGALVAGGLDDGLVARHQVKVEAKVAVAPAIGAAANGSKTLGLAVRF